MSLWTSYQIMKLLRAKLSQYMPHRATLWTRRPPPLLRQAARDHHLARWEHDGARHLWSRWGRGRAPSSIEAWSRAGPPPLPHGLLRFASDHRCRQGPCLTLRGLLDNVVRALGGSHGRARDAEAWAWDVGAPATRVRDAATESILSQLTVAHSVLIYRYNTPPSQAPSICPLFWTSLYNS
jgi:hypothetical protein